MYKELVSAAFNGLIAGALVVTILELLKRKNQNLSLTTAIILAILLGASVGVLSAFGYGYAVDGIITGALVAVLFGQKELLQEKPMHIFGKIILFSILIALIFFLSKIMITRIL